MHAGLEGRPWTALCNGECAHVIGTEQKRKRNSFPFRVRKPYDKPITTQCCLQGAPAQTAAAATAHSAPPPAPAVRATGPMPAQALPYYL